jgi:rod shape-determining protein MreC
VCGFRLRRYRSDSTHRAYIILNLLMYRTMNIYRSIHDMKIRTTTSFATVLKPRPILQMVGMCGLFVAGMALMFMHQKDNASIERIRGSLQAILAPVVGALSAPADFMEEVGANVRNLTTAYAQNNALRSENTHLLEWQIIAKELQQENAELRGLLGVSASDTAQYITARIVSATHDPFGHTLIIEHNGDARIREGMPVIAAEGLVGRVLESTGETARVLLVTDRQSRVPVEQEATSARAILTGLNRAEDMMLAHTEHAEVFKVGDRIVTSKSMLFPIHFVVGEVTSADKESVHIRPYVDARKLRFVSIVVPNAGAQATTDTP